MYTKNKNKGLFKNNLLTYETWRPKTAEMRLILVPSLFLYLTNFYLKSWIKKSESRFSRFVSTIFVAFVAKYDFFSLMSKIREFPHSGLFLQKIKFYSFFKKSGMLWHVFFRTRLAVSIPLSFLAPRPIVGHGFSFNFGPNSSTALLRSVTLFHISTQDIMSVRYGERSMKLELTEAWGERNNTRAIIKGVFTSSRSRRMRVNWLCQVLTCTRCSECCGRENTTRYTNEWVQQLNGE